MYRIWLDCISYHITTTNSQYLPYFTVETLLTNLKILNENICTLHANYISGNVKKMTRMKEYGFWLAVKQSDGLYGDRCMEYVPKQMSIGSNVAGSSDKAVISNITSHA